MSTWVIGDVHGCYNAFQALIESNFIKEEDKVILIGDIIDRGPDSVKMLDWAMQNVNHGGKYYMIRGNHEQNIIDDFTKLVEKTAKKNRYRIQAGAEPLDYKNLSIYDLRCNYDFCEYMERAGILKVGQAVKYIAWMKSLPLYTEIPVTTPDNTGRKYIIAHAWFDIRNKTNRDVILWKRDIRDIPRPNILLDKDGDIIPPLFSNDFEGLENEILIHGHTPVLKDNDYPCNAKVYRRKHSINIDTGAVYSDYGGRLSAIRLEDEKVLSATHGAIVVEDEMYYEKDYVSQLQADRTCDDEPLR